MKNKNYLILLLVFLLGVAFWMLVGRVSASRELFLAKKRELLKRFEEKRFDTRNEVPEALRLCRWAIPATNTFYDIVLGLDEPWTYTAETISDLQCQVDFWLGESVTNSNSCVVNMTVRQCKPGGLRSNVNSVSENRFMISKDFMNEPHDGMYRNSAYKDRFNVFAAIGRQQPTDAGYIYLFVFPPYSGFTTEDTVALFKSPETFPYDEYDGTLIRARLNLTGDADE